MSASTTPLVHVVDDEPTIRELFRRMAAHGAFDVVAHPTGADLLAALDERRAG